MDVVAFSYVMDNVVEAKHSDVLQRWFLLVLE